jgi:hypothetical protein
MHHPIFGAETTSFRLSFPSVPSERRLSNAINTLLGKEIWCVQTCEKEGEYIIYSTRNPEELKASVLKLIAEEEADSTNANPT